MHRQQIEIQDTWVNLATRLEGGRRDRVEARWNFEAMPIATANTIRQSFVGKATLDPYATDAEAAEMAAGRAAIGELLNLTNGYSLDTEFVVKAAPRFTVNEVTIDGRTTYRVPTCRERAPMTTSTKHTPGPWTVDDKANTSGFAIKSTFKSGHEKSGHLYAVANCKWYPWTAEAHHEARANAALIAMAPDMLETLTEAVRIADTQGPITGDYGAMIEGARSILSKLTNS